MSLAWQWVNNRIHSASSVSDALESTHKSISVRSTSVLQCRGPSSSPFFTLQSSDLIISVQTFLSLHVALHLKYCKISASDLLHLYDVSCPSDDFTPYQADCYTWLSAWQKRFNHKSKKFVLRSKLKLFSLLNKRLSQVYKCNIQECKKLSKPVFYDFPLHSVTIRSVLHFYFT